MEPEARPGLQPHDNRGSAVKLQTLFRPTTGEVRAVPRALNPVLHPW